MSARWQRTPGAFHERPRGLPDRVMLRAHGRAVALIETKVGSEAYRLDVVYGEHAGAVPAEQASDRASLPIASEYPLA